MAKLLRYCILITITSKCGALSENKDAVGVIERFVNIRSDIYVTASLPDLHHSQHRSLRLGM